MRLIGESNQFIIAAIRNGIDHNGVNKRNNQMTIRDTNVVFTPNKTSVFKCAAEPEVYFDIVDEVNAIINPTNPALSKPEMLSFDETLEELGYILSAANRKDVFIKFMKAYKNVININMSLMNNGQELKYSSNINRTRQ